MNRSPPAPGSAIVLAGGRSTRFGRDKAAEPLLGRPLLQHVLDRLQRVARDTVVVVARGQVLPPLSPPPRVVEDVYPDSGPLGGIYTGLRYSRADACFVAACDMPLLQPALVAWLLQQAPGHDAIVPVQDGQPQPLCAVYSRACLPVLRDHLDRGALKLSAVLEALQVEYVSPERWQACDPQGLSFINLNREADLLHIQRLLGAAEDIAAEL
jgi:molybdopterin-guanine dinucleotide biosynthesis protein A